jgi:hypothetical protein
MGTTYNYANLTKREWFDASALGGNPKLLGVGEGLTAHAFALLLVDIRGQDLVSNSPGLLGHWAGDSIALIGDSDPAWLKYLEDFADLQADMILLVFRYDGFERLGDVAENYAPLFIQMCHLIVTRQAMHLEAPMKERFGPDYLKRFKELREKYAYFVPKDLAKPAGS